MITMLPALHNLPLGFSARAPPFTVQPPPEPAIVAAARTGDLNEVRELIADGGVDVDERYEFSDTHLPFSQGVPGRAALGVAAFAGHLEVVRVLIAAGADVNQTDEGGFSPLVIAVFRSETAIAHELLAVDGINLEARALLGRTALILAAGLGLVNTVALLIQKGADLTARDDLGRTALNWARALHKDAVATLLEEHGAPE